MRITRNDAPPPRIDARPGLPSLEHKASPIWLGLALVGVALAVVDPGSATVAAAGATITGLGAYLLGRNDRSIPADPRVGTLNARLERAIRDNAELAAILRRDAGTAPATRGPGPGEAADEPRPLAVVPGGRGRGGLDAAAAVDALDAALPGESPGATEE